MRINDEPTKILAIPELLESAGYVKKRAWVGLSDAAKLHFVKHCEGWSAIKIIEVVENELREINNG